MTIPLQRKIIYGPVNSRRLSESLGVNVLPLETKICTFNCLYCQYSWTEIHGKEMPSSKKWSTVEEIAKALEDSLKKLPDVPAYITFSGNGEPTLHPDFVELVGIVNDLRDLYSRQSRTAILSNSTTAGDPKIRKALQELDVRIMKLDCGSEYCFERYNRPCRGVTLNNIVSGLEKLKNITIQSLFTDGSEGNYKPENVKVWLQILEKLKPLLVQIYTLDRPFPEENIQPLEYNKLVELRDILIRRGVGAEVY